MRRLILTNRTDPCVRSPTPVRMPFFLRSSPRISHSSSLEDSPRFPDVLPPPRNVVESILFYPPSRHLRRPKRGNLLPRRDRELPRCGLEYGRRNRRN
ncbi:hypothetical protein IC575_002382 [Cucumis melo]